VTQLLASLADVEGVTVLPFRWRAALLGKYDVFHVHWPENLLKGQSRTKSFARRTFTRLLLLRLRIRKIPIVRTMHNVDRPTGLTGAEYRLLRTIDARTRLVIRLNDQTEIPEHLAFETILHGHYRDWFAGYSRSEAVPGRLGYVGLIRRYKNVPHLVRAVASLPGRFSLRVSGRPSTSQLAAEIEAARGADARILLDFRFLSDAELVRAITEAELIVLPYPEMHNSGSVLASLSLERPVLVKDNDVNRALSTEVGAGWIHLYEGDLEADDILRAHASLKSRPLTGGPDLGLRDWADTGRRHVEAYRRAMVR